MINYLNIRKVLILGVMLTFLGQGIAPLAYAQEAVLPLPGTMVQLSPAYNPPILKGIKVNKNDPFKFEFLLSHGDSRPSVLKEESTRLIKYFLASLTVPEKDLWVNLSPYEKSRIVPEAFGQTQMGRDLLAQDYILKQITASLMYPEGETGKAFWKRIYQQASQLGLSNIPIARAINKVWIMPEKAVVYENSGTGTAYVAQSRLKVLTEADYLALNLNNKENARLPKTSTLAKSVLQEIIIPVLTKEINEGKNFSQLRQIYNSLILAQWYKHKIKEGILNTVYINQKRIAGVSIKNPQEKQKIYERYLEAFKKGAYNYIKEEQDPISHQIVPRKYFSGGATLIDAAQVTEYRDAAVENNLDSGFNLDVVSANLAPMTQGAVDKALVSEEMLQDILSTMKLFGKSWASIKSLNKLNAFLSKIDDPGRFSKAKKFVLDQKRTDEDLIGLFKGILGDDFYPNFKDFFLGDSVFSAVSSRLEKEGLTVELKEHIVRFLKKAFINLITEYIDVQEEIEKQDISVSSLQGVDQETMTVKGVKRDGGGEVVIVINRRDKTFTIADFVQGQQLELWLNQHRQTMDLYSIVKLLQEYLKLELNLLNDKKMDFRLSPSRIKLTDEGRMVLINRLGVTNYDAEDLNAKENFIWAIVHLLIGEDLKEIKEGWEKAREKMFGFSWGKDLRMQNILDQLSVSANNPDENLMDFVKRLNQMTLAITNRPQFSQPLTVNYLKAAQLEESFEGILSQLLEGKDSLQKMDEEQWARLRYEFLSEIRKRGLETELITDDFQELLEAYLNPVQLRMYQPAGELTKDQIVLIIQHLHALSLNLLKTGVSIDQLRQENLKAVLDTWARFSYVFFVKALAMHDLGGESWEKVLADAEVVRRLRADDFDVAINDISKYKAFCEVIGISDLARMYEGIFRYIIDHHQNFFTNGVINPKVYEDVSEEIGEFIFADLGDLLTMMKDFQNLQYEEESLSPNQPLPGLGLKAATQMSSKLDIELLLKGTMPLSLGTPIASVPKKKVVTIKMKVQEVIQRDIDSITVAVLYKGQRRIIRINDLKNKDEANKREAILRNIVNLQAGQKKAVAVSVIPLIDRHFYAGSVDGKQHLYFIVSEDEGKMLSDYLIENQVAGNWANLLVLSAKAIYLYAQLFNLGFVSPDLNNMSKIAVEPGQELKLVQLSRLVAPDKKRDQFSYKRQLIESIVRIIFGIKPRNKNKSFDDIDWDSVKGIVNMSDERIREGLGAIVSTLKGAYNSRIDFAEFLTLWNENILPRLPELHSLLTNAAMSSSPKREGGIDFKAGHFPLEVKNNDGNIHFKVSPAMLAQYKNVQGFSVTINDIKPLVSVKDFLK